MQDGAAEAAFMRDDEDGERPFCDFELGTAFDQRDSRPRDGRRAAGEHRSPGTPLAPGTARARAVAQVMRYTAGGRRLARPRPIRPPAGHASMLLLLDALPGRLRPRARRRPQFPSVGFAHAGTPRAVPTTQRRGDDQPSRPGFRQRRRNGARRGPPPPAFRPRGGRPPRLRDLRRRRPRGHEPRGRVARPATLGLGRLVYVYDDNHITIDGPTELSYSDNVPERFAGYGWHVGAAWARRRTILTRSRWDSARESPSRTGRRSSSCVGHIGWPSPMLHQTPHRSTATRWEPTRSRT